MKKENYKKLRKKLIKAIDLHIESLQENNLLHLRILELESFIEVNSSHVMQDFEK